MAAKSQALLVLVVLAGAAACLAQLGAAARPGPARAERQQAAAEEAAAAAEGVKRPATFQEGTVVIPGIGRYEVGSHYVPDMGGLDHSVPAAEHGQFIPGADDTWVPNPGFEVPNPFRPGSSAP